MKGLFGLDFVPASALGFDRAATKRESPFMKTFVKK